MKKARVLFLDHASIMGGAESSLLLLLKALDNEKFDLILACPSESPLTSEALTMGVTVRNIEIGRLKRIKNPFKIAFRLVKGLYQVVTVIRRENVDIVHSNTTRMSIYGAIAAKITGKHLVWHVREIYSDGIYKAVLGQMADRIASISLAVKQSLPRQVWGKTRVILNSLDLTQFELANVDHEAFRKNLGISAESVLIGNVGWISPVKEVDVFLDAAARIAAKYPRARFVVIGDSADESFNEYTRGIRLSGERLLGDRVIWAGARDDMVEAMAGIDILAHSAREEAFGMVLIEAMALGKPVVAPACSGPAEIVEDGRTGLLFAPGDSVAMADTISALLESPDYARSLGEAGMARVTSHFSADREARQFEDLYDSLHVAARKVEARP